MDREGEDDVQALTGTYWHLCARGTHIALEEAGAPYEAVAVDFSAQAQRTPEYLPSTRKGGYPRWSPERQHADRDARAAVVCGAAFPAAELALLADPFLLARVQEFNSYLCATVTSRTRMAAGAPVGRTTMRRSRRCGAK